MESEHYLRLRFHYKFVEKLYGLRLRIKFKACISQSLVPSLTVTTVDDTSTAKWKDYCTVYEWITLHCSAPPISLLDTSVFLNPFNEIKATTTATRVLLFIVLNNVVIRISTAYIGNLIGNVKVKVKK